MDDKRAVFEEAVAAILPMFKEGGSEHHGKYFDIPLRNVVPKPIQKPHPPLWMACSQLDTIERAGRCGHGGAGLPVRQCRCGARLGTCLLQCHHQALGKARRLSRKSQHRAGQLLHVRQDRRGSAQKADGATFFQFALRFYGASSDRKRPAPGTVNMWDEYNAWKRANPAAQEAALRGGLIGSPDTLRKKLAEVRDLAHRSSDPAQPGRQKRARGHRRLRWSCSPKR